MPATRLPRLVLSAVAVWMLLSPGPAWSVVVPGDIVLTFTELANEGGIRVTETGAPQGNGTLTVSGETVTISPPPFSCQAGNFCGLGTSANYIFNLLEPDGTISDQVIVTGTGGCGPDCEGDPVSVKFTSDPAQFVSGIPNRSVTEDGTTQFVGSYVNDRGTTVKIFVLSDVDAAVPSPATLLLLGAGLTTLAGTAWRRQRRA